MRACVLSRAKNNPIIVSQCDLTEVVALAQNKRMIRQTQGYNRDKQIMETYGDVLFMKVTLVMLVFAGVLGPDDIVNVVNQLKKSYYLE